MDGYRYAHSEHHDEYGQHIEPQSSFLEGGEEAGSHLETEGEHEEDQAEVTYEPADRRIDGKSEMGQDDTDEEYPRHPEGYAEDLDLAQHNPQRNYNGNNQNRMRHAI